MELRVTNIKGQQIHQTTLNNPWVDGKKDRSILKSHAVTISVKVTSVSRWAINCLKDAFKYSGSAKFPNGLKLVNILTVPIHIYHIIKSVPKLFSSSKSERADAGLNITTQVGNIGDAVATFSEGLGAVSAVALNALNWTPALFGVGVALQTAGMAATMKNMVERHKFKKLFNDSSALTKKVNDYALEDFRNGIRLIEQKRITQEQFISKHFGVDENRFVDNLIEIDLQAQVLFASQNPEEVLKGKQLVHDTMKTLSKRMTNLNRSGAVNLVTATVGYVGLAALFSPATPAVGFGILALSGGASIVQYAIDRKVTKRFERKLGMLADTNGG